MYLLGMSASMKKLLFSNLTEFIKQIETHLQRSHWINFGWMDIRNVKSGTLIWVPLVWELAKLCQICTSTALIYVLNPSPLFHLLQKRNYSLCAKKVNFGTNFPDLWPFLSRISFGPRTPHETGPNCILCCWKSFFLQDVERFQWHSGCLQVAI